jgi:uncharacterized membrane-anchored protein YhcB (DUF1043 family)
MLVKLSPAEAAVGYLLCVLQAETEAAMSALREEAVGLREALDAQRTQLERHYAGLHAKMRKEYEQVRPLVLPVQ